MSNKFIFFIIIVVVAIGVGVYYFVPFDDPAEVANTDPTGEVAGEDASRPEFIRADHFFADGVHTIQGLIDLPTPCHEFSHDVLIAESFPEQVTINFVVTPGPSVCTKQISEKFFNVSFNASENAVIKATYNGEQIELRLNEAGDPSSIQKQ